MAGPCIEYKGKQYSYAEFTTLLHDGELSNLVNDGILKGFEDIPNELKIVKNEKAPATNTPANGNVQPRVEPMGESGVSKPKSPAKESVPSTANVSPSQGANEVTLDDIQNFINETYLNDEKASPAAKADQGAIEDSNEKNRAIPIVEKGRKQVKVTKEGKVSMQGRKSLAKRQFKGDRKTASEIDPTDATSLALKYFVNGGKVASDYFTTKGERQARTNGLNGIASKEAKTAKGRKATIDEIAHDIWESAENNKLNIDSRDIKNAVEDVVNGNLTVQNVVDSLLKSYNVEKEDLVDYERKYAEAFQEFQEEGQDYAEENIQEVASALDYLSDAEIVELANSEEKSFDDYVRDLESRQVTYDFGPFVSEKGTIQPDGSILSENGDLLSAESVKNVKQINPGVKAVEKPKAPVSKKSPELIEVNKRLKEAQEKEKTAKDALLRKMAKLDNEAIKDNQDLFGKRKSEDANLLFDERVDSNARNKALEKEKAKLNEIREEIKSLKEAKAKIESGEIVSTSEMDFEAKKKVDTGNVEINKQIENGNITPKQVDEFVNDDRKAAEIEPIVKAVESKAKSNSKVELKQVVVDVKNEIEREPADRGNDGGVQKYSGRSLAQQENKRPGIVVQAESKMPPAKDFVSKDYPILDEVQKQGVNSALSLFENGGKSFLLADGTGVGKTMQILATAKAYLDKFGGKVLIISENDTILTQNFPKDAGLLGVNLKEFELGTYNELRTGKKGKGDYSLVIYDEAHNLKNQESGKTIAAGNIKSKNNMYVTATPMDTIGSAVYFISEVSGVTEEEAYNMLGLNVKKQKDSLTGQEVKIVTLQEGVAPADIKRNIIKIREQMISKGSMLRREYPFYGDFVEDKISLTQEEISEQEEIESSWDDRIEIESMTENGGVNFNKKRNLSGQKSGELGRWSESTKIKYTLKEIIKEIKAGKKVVVIAEGVNQTTITAIDKVVPGFLSELSKMLKAEGYKVAEIFGKSNKGEAVQLFQSNKIDVVLGTAKSASTGIDLDDQTGNAPRVLFMVTPNYSGNVFQQTVGRVSRRNTKSPAQVRLLYNESNIDARRRQIVTGKLQTLKAIQEGVIDDEIDVDIQEAPIPAADIKINLENISLEDISERAFVVKGDTKPIKENLRAIGGSFKFKYQGWTFSKAKRAEVVEMLNKLSDKNQPSEEAKKLSDKVRNLKIDLGKMGDGGLQSNPLGLPVAIWNASMDIIATSIDAGMEIGEAIKRGLNYIQKNNRGQWNKKQFNDEVLKELGVRGIEVNGQDVIVKPQTKEDAKVVDGFYSDIEKSLIDTKKDNLTASEWETIIGKTDEAKFTGLTDFINSKKGTISKAEIREYLNDNRIEIVEVAKQDNAESYSMDRYEDFPQEVQNIADEVGEDENEFAERLKAIGYEVDVDMDGSILSFNKKGEENKFEKATKFSQYQLEGESENYKEILVTLPSKGNLKERWGVFDKNGKLVSTYLSESKAKDKSKSIGGYYQIADNVGAADPRLNFKSSHFDEANILVHLRMNTRTDADGKKVLFLEEVQSDWGQQGKKEGFKNEEIANEREKLRLELQNKKDKVRKIENQLANLKPLTSEQKSELNQEKLKLEEARNNVRNNREWDAIGKEIANINEKIDSYENNKNILKSDIYELNYIGDSSISNLSDNLYEFDKKNPTEGTLTAPFVMDTNSWAKLGVKVALKEAVKQGVDKIAWTTGEQQNERYDLSKTASSITHLDRGDGTYKVEVFEKGTSRTLWQKDDATLKEIEDTVGKDIANKIKEGDGNYETDLKGEKISDTKVLKGDDLKVGGKGMKGFYGSVKEGNFGIVGEVVKALTKQEPKITSIRESQKEYRIETDTNEDGTFNVYITGDAFYGAERGEGFKTRKEAQDFAEKEVKYLKELENTSEQYSIDITPKLKSEVEKGLPMFGNLKEQQKAMVNAEVDRIAQKVKDLLPGIKDPNLKKQGLSQDDLIDLVASAVKALVSKGIDINDAIQQVVASIKERFNVDVDQDLVKAKLNITNIPQDFERQQGRKSVLNRMASGNSAIIKKAIAKYSLDYEIENQKEAKEKADAFVDEIGYDNALNAVRKGLVDGAQGAFIYARAIEILEKEINTLKGEDRLDAIADYQELLGQISDELDNRSRSNGRFIAALAEIYNSSGGRYNLTKMVNDYKAQNNGVISKEVLEKLKNVEEKLKESEAKLAELEAKKRIEEENEAFNNILESVARKKAINTNAKITDKQKAKAFADKLRSFKISNLGGTNVATPFSIAYDFAIETAAQALELSGIVSDAIKAGVESIRNANLSKDEQQQALSDLFDLFDDSDVTENTSQKGMMSVNEEGVLRIPHSLIREKVENGVDNIEDLVSELMADVEELFPDSDFTERQVRDAVTGYGKISNPTSDEIETQISIIKSIGKIASGIEDANKGQRPLRSGQQRREPTMKERTEMKKLKALLRDLPLADADITKAYKTALDAIKKRLSNEIEELDEQIAKGEKRKGQKTVIEYDQEAKDLKAIRDSKKVELDELVGKPELTEQQKIDRAEKLLQKRLDDLQQKIDGNEIDYAKKPEPVTSAKLEEMRKLKKELEAQIQKMREDAGMAEARLVESAKRNASKRLAALKERIANKDFSPRKRKPTPTDVELNKVRAEIAEQKEIFDKEVYKLELKNRRIEQKAFDVLKDILSIPKILSFTLDLSFVGIQNVTQVYKMGANSIVNLAKTGKLKGTFRDAMAKTFKAMASPDFEQKFMQAVKANPNYQLWKDSKLGIVESHYKESAKAEVFQNNAISTLFDILGNYVASKGYDKAGDIIKNYINVISIFERGQTVFENQMRINRFQEGADLLKSQGFNPIDDIKEYRKVAAAVNTLTGRANTGSKAAAALREANGTLFSSFSNWAAGVNQLNPYWYYTLTPTARKMALTDVAHHIIGAGSLLSMAAIYALGQDDDDEDKVTIGTDATNSDFAVIKVGNLRIDPWAGKKTTVVAFARLASGGKTDKYGNFKKYGIEYEDEDWIDLPLEYAGNKIAPGPRFIIDRFFKTKEVKYNGKTFREDKFGKDFKESKYLVPLIFENFKEVNEEQPGLFGKATMALSWTGTINTNVYGGEKEGFKDMPDDLVEKEYRVKIQKIKDDDKKLEFNVEKLTKEYVEKKINKFQIMQKVDSLVQGEPELFNKTMKSIIQKVNKEELKTLVTDPFYLGLKKEKNPEIQAIYFYNKFKDDKGMSDKDKAERNKNLRYIEFDFQNPKFIKAYQELLKNGKKKPVN